VNLLARDEYQIFLVEVLEEVMRIFLKLRFSEFTFSPVPGDDSYV
jgi:hypothetical protein